MPLHGNAIRAAVKKYGHLEDDMLLQALKVDPDYTPEDQKEIYVRIIEVQKEEAAKIEAAIPKTSPGKKLYDKWMGSWKPMEIITNPFDGRKTVITWLFERSGLKANKTNIPLTDRQVQIFNDARRIQAANVPTEQLFPAGTTTDIYDRLPNPFEVQTIR